MTRHDHSQPLHPALAALSRAATALTLAVAGEAPHDLERQVTHQRSPHRPDVRAEVGDEASADVKPGTGGEHGAVDPEVLTAACAALCTTLEEVFSSATFTPVQRYRIQPQLSTARRAVDQLTATTATAAGDDTDEPAALGGTLDVEAARTAFTGADATALRILQRRCALVAAQVQLGAAAPLDVALDGSHMPGPQRASWQALIDVAAQLPGAWTLVGGQMVALHCWERGQHPTRPTNDGDAVLDIRADQRIHARFTAALTALGFTVSASNDLTEYEHRWRRQADDAQVDILLPSGTGQRAAARPNTAGGLTLATPGGADALRHSRAVRVHLDGSSALIRRPHLVGALIAKTRACGNTLDDSARHLQDAAVLLGLLGAQDRPDLDFVLSIDKHRATLGELVQRLQEQPRVWAAHRSSAERGLQNLQRRLG